MQMLLRRTTWLEAAWIFVTSRLVILFITFIAIIRILPGNQEITHICANYSCLLAWLHYDTGVYINLAMNGYRNFQDTVFFPLWPLLVHYVGITFGASTISYYVASLLLANLFFYLILVVFYCLLRIDV